MEPRTIVAIEIASSKIKGAAASVSSDGRLSVLAVEEIPGTNNVRYGRIQNIREVSGAVNEIISRLEDSPGIAPRKISSLAVALGGRSLSAVPAKAALKFPHECEITDSQVQRLMFEASRDFMGDKNIEATVPRMFYVNNAAVRKAVGTFGETLRGEFMMLTCGKETRQNLDRLKYDTIEHDNVHYVLRATAVGDLVLKPGERELGCALVDFGAETTTVSVYKDGTLAFLSTIPMGSRLITLDLMAGLGITEEASENYKLTLGTMVDGTTGQLSGTNAAEVNSYVRARAGEIAANILNQIELSGYNADSLSTIVLTGGGSKLPEFAAQLGTLSKMNVRVAEMPSDITFRVAGRNNADNIDIVALLMAAARTSDRTYLTTPAPKERVVVMDENEEDDEVVTDDEDEQEYVRPELRKRPAVRPEHARFMPPARKTPQEDDEDLLADDKDEEEEDEERNPAPRKEKRRGFFGFKKKSKEKEEDYDDPEDDEEVEEDDYDESSYDDDEADVTADDYSPEDDLDHFKETKTKLGNLREKFINIFRSEDSDDENY